MGDTLFLQYRSEFSKRAKQLCEHALEENAKISRKHCESHGEELWRNKVEKKLRRRGAYLTLEELLHDWEQLQQTFLAETKGPGQVTTLSGVLFRQMATDVLYLSDQLAG